MPSTWLRLAWLRGERFSSNTGYTNRRRRTHLEHRGQSAVEKIKHSWPLTREDVTELQRVLVDSGIATASTSKGLTRGAGFGLFIRQLVGLDRAAASDAFSEFLDEKRFNSSQIQFINVVIDYLSQNGVVEARQFYTSPFTDLSPQGPDALFESADVDRLLAATEDVRRRVNVA
jgi:type I restriction enzyme R subunit